MTNPALTGDDVPPNRTEPVAGGPGEGQAPPVTPAPAKRGRPRKASGATKKAAAAAKKEAAPKTPGRPSADAQLTRQLTDLFVNIGTGAAILNEADGVAIIEGSPALAESLAQVAAANPKVKAALTRTTSAAGWGGVVIAVAGIALPILANHGILPGAPELPPGGMAGLEAMAEQMAADVMNDPAKLADLMAQLTGGGTQAFPSA